MGKFYLTTTLPYVNDRPHVGFALEIVQADALARFRRLVGDEVFFNFGTDEHGQKIYQKAQEAGESPQSYADRYASTFKELKDALDLSYDAFIRTTDLHHKSAAQEFWKRCTAAGDIYKKTYQIRYCVGCELEKTDSELVDGKCPLHPNLEIELIDEENYFFRLSKYQDRLLELYDKNHDFVIPDFRLNEIRSLIAGGGLQDFSISRLRSKLPWGVPVPDDPEQVMYVWFDALVNYISTLGWPEDEKKFEEFWGTKEIPNAIQFAGKDQVRQQAAMWQAMLMSAGLPTSKQIFIHGFISVNGAKMSKSLGNVIYPVEFAKQYGTDALRYFLLRHIHPFEDSDFSEERFREAYNANLANGLGNLVARVMTLAEEHLSEPVSETQAPLEPLRKAFDRFNFNEVIEFVFGIVSACDGIMSSRQPYKAIKVEETKERARQDIKELRWQVKIIGEYLRPLMPSTSKIILDAVRTNKKPGNLFPRLD